MWEESTGKECTRGEGHSLNYMHVPSQRVRVYKHCVSLLTNCQCMVTAMVHYSADNTSISTAALRYIDELNL